MGRAIIHDLPLEYPDYIVKETWLPNTTMRNIERLRAEIRLLEEEYGPEKIVWASDYSWILIKDWKLPPGYNTTHINVLVIVPDKYGYGPFYQDFFVPSELRIKRNGNWATLPHYFGEYPYKNRLDSALVSELERNGWSYVCLHPERPIASDNIVTYLTQVYTFLSDPFRAWER